MRPKKRKYKTLEQKTAQELVKEADKFYSRYVRLRDSEYNAVTGRRAGNCITCDKRLVVIDEFGKWNKDAQNCHLIGRAKFITRFDDENCNLGCSYCNAWLDKDTMIDWYRKAVDAKYGDGTYKKLKKMGDSQEAYARPLKQELLQIIADCKTEIEWFEKNKA